MTDFNASAIETDPQGLAMLRSVLGQPKRAPAGEASLRAAEASAELRSVRRRAGRTRAESRPSF